MFIASASYRKRDFAGITTIRFRWPTRYNLIMMMKALSLLSVFVVVLVSINATSFGQTSAEETPHAPPISIVTLLAEPASNSPQRVQVAGFLTLEFEGQALYLHEEDYQQQITRNAIRIALTPEQETQYKELSGSYVLVEGSFKKIPNSEDIFTGSLFQIRRIVKLLPRRR